MAKLISGINCVEAWKNAAIHLLANGKEDFNVIIEIQKPEIYTAQWMYKRKYDPSSISNAVPIHTVVNTIFPHGLERQSPTRQEFYSKYLSIFNNSRSKKWGTYFQRLISFGNQQHNQLETIIQKLISWQHVKTPFIFHTSSADTDSIRRLGNPCLQYGEFIWHNHDIIDLVAVYRNHDYFQKALGNFIGLSKLLEFVCKETNKNMGKLVIHSVHAYFDVSYSKMQTLVSR